jgi:hypothetical protein
MSGHPTAERDHWDIYAETMDLTIEGHQLLAQELVCELKSLGRWLARGGLALVTLGLSRAPHAPRRDMAPVRVRSR